MRKLKLEVQISVDGFIADENGGMSWMIWPYTPEIWSWDKKLQQHHIEQTTSSDCILLSGNMAGGFHDFWENVAQNPKDPRYAFAKPITDMKKVVFSRKLKKSTWKNTELTTGNYVDYIKQLKKEKGKDIICYGGATFISSLIEEELIDEFKLIINPTIIGTGLSIFNTNFYSDLNITPKQQPLPAMKNRFYGEMNGGGKMIVINTSTGNVFIRKQP